MQRPGDRERTAGAPLPLGSNTLPVGHTLHEFVIEGLVGEGGFSLVYLARDTHLQRVVAIKEYMPSGLASRNDDHSVSARSQRDRETFELGLRSFVNEARLLASFDHPALLKVYRFWEQHGTAYMVMPYYQGPTLKQWLAEQAQPPGEAWLKALLVPLLESLEAIHADHCYHRDIAPDNILLLGPDRPLLLDFGAARRVIGDATQVLTIILKPGYAPIEQYAEVPGMKQGAWTDVYALCAVLYRAICGTSPVTAVSRMMKDELVPASQLAAGRYSQEFLAAIDLGLAVRPAHRPQNIAALRAALFTQGTLEAEHMLTQDLDDRATVLMPAAAKRVNEDRLVADPASRPDRRGASVAPASSSRGVRWAGAGAVLLLLAIGGWWMFMMRAAPPAAPPAAKEAAVSPATAASVAVAAPPSGEARAPPASTAVAATSPPLNPTTTAPISDATTAAPREPFSVSSALAGLARQADPTLAVTLVSQQPRLVIGRDRLSFRVTSSAPGHLYLFLANADGSRLYRFFPNAVDRANRIQANEPLLLPREGWHLTATGPAGLDHVLAVVSEHAHDFARTGLRLAADVPVYDLRVLEKRWGDSSSPGHPLLGAPKCDAGAACGPRFGAALTQFEVVAR